MFLPNFKFSILTKMDSVPLEKRFLEQVRVYVFLPSSKTEMTQNLYNI